MAINGLEYYVSQLRGRFSTSAEPTLEDAGATDSIKRTIVSGGQVADLVDGDRNGRLTVGTDLLTGDDSTFASDTGNWTLGAGMTIAGGKLVLTNVSTSVEASITVPLAAATYATSFAVTGLDPGNEELRIEVGDANGTITDTDGTITEDLSPASGTTIRFEVTSGPIAAGTIDLVTVRLKDTYRADMAADRRFDADCFVVDNQNVRDVFPGDERTHQTLSHDTDAAFSGATDIVPSSEYAGLIGAERAYLDFVTDDKVTVSANDAIKNIWDGGGSLIVEIYPRSDGGGDLGRIVSKSASDTVGWDLITRAESGSFVRVALGLVTDGTDGLWSTTTAIVPINQWSTIGISFNSLSGDPIFYLNGVLTASEETTTPTGDRVSDTATDMLFGDRASGSRAFDGRMKRVIPYNTVLSASEFLAQYNGGLVTGALQTNLFSNPELTTDTTGFTDTNYVLSRVDSAADPGTGSTTAGALNDSVLKAVADGGSGRQIITSVTVVSGTIYRHEFIYYNPAGDPDLFVNLGSQSNLSPGTGVLTTKDGWSRVIFETTSSQAGAVNYVTAHLSAGGAIGDILYLDALRMTVAGAVAIYEPEGISTEQGTWFDRSTNSLDGTISGAEGRNNPGNSIYFAKFTSVNARYWFLQFNPDSLTYVGAYKVGQWDICKTFRPSLNPDATGVVPGDNYDGIATVPKYGGGLDLSERYGRRRTWVYDYSFLSAADISSIQDMFEQSKKRPIYFTENADDAEPIIFAARLLENPSYPRPAAGAHNVTLAFIEEV